MANEINNQRFYMFLSSFEGKGGWVSAADQDGDNYIMQCEFYDFIKDNWDGENTPSDDLINKFWNSLDTNTSTSKIKGTNLRNLNALDKKEMEDLEKHLASYVAFDTFFGQGGPVELEKSNLRANGILTNSNYLNQWKGAVKDALSVLFAQLVAENPNITEEKVTEALTAKFEEVKNAITAEYIGVEYISNLQSTVLRGYDCDLASDEYLANILNNFSNQYLNNMLRDPQNYTLQGLKEGIVSLINKYLEKAGITAPGSNDASTEDIKDYGYNDAIITNLQKQVVLNTILENEDEFFNSLKQKSNGKHDYLADAKKYLMQLIEDYISKGYSFEQLKRDVKFEGSEYCDKLNNLIEFDKTYDDIEKVEPTPKKESGDEIRAFFTNTQTDLYTRLSKEFGADFADLVAETDQYLEAYKKIIADAREKYMNAEFATGQELQDYIFEQIKLSLADFYAEKINSISDIQELNKIYDNLTKSADAQKNLTDRTNAYRNAAIMYCDVLADKFPTFTDLFKEIFGTENYTKVINKYSVDQIKEYMNDLKVKAEELQSLQLGAWTGIEDNITMNLGSEYNSKVSVAIANIDPSRITYDWSTTNGLMASVDCFGNLKIQSLTTPGIAELKIYAKVDGVRVGEPKVITVKTAVQLDCEKAEDVKTPIAGYALSDIITSKPVLTLANSNNYGVGNMKDIIFELIDSIASALDIAGYDKNQIKKATTITKNYYEKALANIYERPINDASGFVNIDLKYNFGDVERVEYTNYYASTAHKSADTTGKEANNAGTGIQVSDNNKSGCADYFFISLYVLVQKFEDFYNQL